MATNVLKELPITFVGIAGPTPLFICIETSTNSLVTQVLCLYFSLLL